MEYQEERRQVLAAARKISGAGLVTGTWGNVSARCGEKDLMIVTPSGVSYDTLRMEDMVLVDGSGQVLEGRLKPSSEVSLHMGIYKNRPDVKAIIHTHSLYAAAFAVAGKSLPVILEETAQVIGHEVPVADYALCGTDSLAANAVKALGKDKQAVLLANHGLVTLGSSMAEALKKAQVIEKTSQVFIYAQILGGAKIISQEDTARLKEKFKNYGQ
ncbi:MAG TPA: class II aldolase/adducin family protein [Clostridia bacterium]|jgi:L-ribulose-5-phosphate 4-epimerase|nr:class II aldolase/adducin family protein [Clostridia bacterium]